MKQIKKFISKGTLAIVGTIFIASCSPNFSNITGWNYNDPKNGGFQQINNYEQETGPGLVLIEGGTFTMGRTEQDVMYEWAAIPRRITVSSFYMDEAEISNLNYLEYLFWTRNVYGADYDAVYKKALPDTLVWRDKLAYNEPYVDYYLRHPAYQDYPVVGVNWKQATDFCAWRTDRVNEFILVREGLIEFDPASWVNENNFNTEAYLAGQYEGLIIKNIPDLNPKSSGERKVRMEDGILFPRYRLPTEAEWEFAAYSLIGNSAMSLITERKIYPWNGSYVRNSDEKYLGQMMANFKRGRGDNMGVAGALNDNADVTAPVYSYWPNDYGLYNMAGNISEWVMDVYRPLTNEDKSDFRSFRGSVYQTYERDEEGVIAEKDSLGHLKMRDVQLDKDNLAERRNYRRADNKNVLDGDKESQVDGWTDPLDTGEGSKEESASMYDYSLNSMVNDRARVYKGASWKDRAYFMNPGTRRYLDEKMSTDAIGFRCAMVRVGSPVGLGK